MVEDKKIPPPRGYAGCQQFRTDDERMRCYRVGSWSWWTRLITPAEKAAAYRKAQRLQGRWSDWLYKKVEGPCDRPGSCCGGIPPQYLDECMRKLPASRRRKALREAADPVSQYFQTHVRRYCAQARSQVCDRVVSRLNSERNSIKNG